MGLSDERKLLLLKGAKSGGTITYSMAERLYSSPKSARSALSSLEYKGYIKYRSPGIFEIVSLPGEVIEKYRAQKEE